jgi:hypothetical protein
MKRTAVGGLNAPAGTPLCLLLGGAIDHTRPRQAGVMEWRSPCLLYTISLSIKLLLGESVSSLSKICFFVIRTPFSLSPNASCNTRSRLPSSHQGFF